MILPIEILELVVESLDPPDLCSVRLVNRHSCRAANRAFVSGCFATLTTDFSLANRRRLHFIATHPDFSLAVQTLRVTSLHPRNSFGHGYIWLRAGSGALDLTSPAVREVQNLISHLGRCHTLELDDACKDGIYEYANDHDEIELSPVDALYLALSTPALGKGFNVSTLRVRTERHLAGYQLPPSSTSYTTSLQRLDLDLFLGFGMISNVVDLIGNTRCLDSLSLKLGPIFINFANKIYERVARLPVVPPLEHLRLSFTIGLCHGAMAAFLCRFRSTLRSLEIRHVVLDRGSWHSVLGRLAEENLPCLESIALYSLGTRDDGLVFFCPFQSQQDFLRSCDGSFEFTLKELNGKDRVDGVHYRGSQTDARRVLGMLGREELTYIL